MSLSGATVVLTGGTGSFGNAATARLLGMKDGPACIRVFSRDEAKQAEMRQRFNDDHRLRFLLGDVRDLARLESAFRDASVVVHAAALKRVDACAYNPTEAVQTNVLGSMNVLAAGRSCSVGKIVALSSDKACAPSTTYGATKACMEHIFTASTSYVGAATRCSVVRYGNVAGSRGSVIPTWREALTAGRPIKVLSPSATRFWFTLDGAVDLVLWTLNRSLGGELVVPRLPSFRLLTLAEAMGATKQERMDPAPGEKLHEIMVSRDEARHFHAVDGHLVRLPVWAGSGEPMADGEYSSNPATMSVEDLRRELGRL